MTVRTSPLTLTWLLARPRSPVARSVTSRLNAPTGTGSNENRPWRSVVTLDGTPGRKRSMLTTAPGTGTAPPKRKTVPLTVPEAKSVTLRVSVWPDRPRLPAARPRSPLAGSVTCTVTLPGLTWSTRYRPSAPVVVVKVPLLATNVTWAPLTGWPLGSVTRPAAEPPTARTRSTSVVWSSITVATRLAAVLLAGSKVSSVTGPTGTSEKTNRPPVSVSVERDRPPAPRSSTLTNTTASP